MKWDEMTPRERDALVATKVMRWTRKVRPGGGGGCVTWDNVDGSCSGWLESDASMMTVLRLFHPSTDISAAWEVVEKFGFCHLYKGDVPFNGQWECKLTDVDARELYAVASTAPEAICLAALRAVGVDV